MANKNRIPLYKKRLRTVGEILACLCIFGIVKEYEFISHSWLVFGIIAGVGLIIWSKSDSSSKSVVSDYLADSSELTMIPETPPTKPRVIPKTPRAVRVKQIGAFIGIGLIVILPEIAGDYNGTVVGLCIVLGCTIGAIALTIWGIGSITGKGEGDDMTTDDHPGSDSNSEIASSDSSSDCDTGDSGGCDSD